MDGVKDKILSPSNINSVFEDQKKPRIRKIKIKKSKDNIITSIEAKIIKDIRNIFAQEEVCYKPVIVGNFYRSNNI